MILFKISLFCICINENFLINLMSNVDLYIQMIMIWDKLVQIQLMVYFHTSNI